MKTESKEMKAARKTMLLLGMVLITAACSPRTTLPPAWQAQSPSVRDTDGWTEPGHHHPRAGLAYAVSNDEEYLYVLLQTNDPATRLKILRAGMEVSIDTLGRRKGHLSITYPDPMDIGFTPGLQDRGDRLPGPREGVVRPGRQRSDAEREADRIAMLQNLLQRHTSMTLSGFRNHPNGLQPLYNEEGLQLHMEIDSTGLLTYRAAIPLHTFTGQAGQKNRPNRNFGMKVTVKGMGRVPGNAGSMRDGRTGSPGMSPPGGIPGGRPMPGGSPGRGPGQAGGFTAADPGSLTEEQTLHIRFSLAARP